MLGLLCSGSSLASHAQEDEKPRDPLLSARLLYEELEYERALEALAQARRFSRSRAESVTISLYEGVILGNLGKKDAAIAAFKAALVLQPKVKLPMKVGPTVQQHFEVAREEVKRERAKQEAERPVAEVTPVSPQSVVRRREQAKRGKTQRETVKQEPATQGAELLVAQVRPEPRSPSAEERPEQDKPFREPEPQVELVQTKPLGPVAQAGHAESISTPSASIAGGAGSSMRNRAWLPASAGGVLLVAGGASWLMARSEASKLDNNDPRLTTRADVEASASSGRTWQTVGMGLAGAGVLGLGIAGVMYLAGAPLEPEKTELGLSTDGTSAFVYGRLP